MRDKERLDSLLATLARNVNLGPGALARRECRRSGGIRVHDGCTDQIVPFGPVAVLFGDRSWRIPIQRVLKTKNPPTRLSGDGFGASIWLNFLLAVQPAHTRRHLRAARTTATCEAGLVGLAEHGGILRYWRGWSQCNFSMGSIGNLLRWRTGGGAGQD